MTVLVTAVLIWRNSRYALLAAIATLAANVLGLLVLLIAFRDVVAQASLAAMTFRIVVWLIILALMVAARKKQTAIAIQLDLSRLRQFPILACQLN